jgi:hypothetical protein
LVGLRSSGKPNCIDLQKNRLFCTNCTAAEQRSIYRRGSFSPEKASNGKDAADDDRKILVTDHETL